MEKKICSKCKIEKDVCEFYKNPKKENEARRTCKICMNKYSTSYSQNNKEKVHKIKQKYVDNNKEKVKKSKKDWFNKNTDYQNKWVIYKYNNEPLFKLINIMRARTRLFFKSKNLKKQNSTLEIIGCAPVLLKEHLENQFTEGMSWDNHGQYGWHIDHIIPLSSAKTEEEIYKLSHYTNLQPLWAKDNLKKGDKILTFLS
jgi:hypothetical protein